MFHDVTAGQSYIGNRELAIATGFVTESDAGVLAAGQAHTVFITRCTLVVVKVRMTLFARNVRWCVIMGRIPYQRPAGMSAGELKVAWGQTATCLGVSEVWIPQFSSVPKGAIFGSCPGSEMSLT